MKSLNPNYKRRKRTTSPEPENIAFNGDHVFIRRWAIDARCNVIHLEVSRHA